MTILKKLSYSFGVLMSVLLFMSVSTLPNSSTPVPKTAKQTPLELFSNVRDVLQTKATQGDLSKAEARVLKMVDKKVTKWEARNAKRIAKGKKPVAGKSWMTALLLVIFVGVLGIHRFYLGYTWQGVVQLLTLGGFGIWSLIDLIRIITRDLQPNGSSYID